MDLQTVYSSLTGIVVKISVSIGSQINEGQELLILESMKMENAISAPFPGTIKSIQVEEGNLVKKGDPIFQFKKHDPDANQPGQLDVPDVQQDISLTELRSRKKYLNDENRPTATEKRKRKNKNTARQNIDQLVDAGSFREYGGLTVAAQRSRRSMDDLMENTPADGLIAGKAKVNGKRFASRTDIIAMAYDYTVLAGTQGTMNHLKMDRMIELAMNKKLPVVLFAEGGGGRPGDVDVHTIAGLYISTFTRFAALKAVVPTISVVSGYCFAGNAALAGSSDIIIATADSSIGMGGPAMIEGGGLGKFHPGEVGPSEVQTTNGVIDILAEDDVDAVEKARQFLSFWQGDFVDWESADQEELQHFIPQNRKRNFDCKRLVQILVDRDSFLELQPEYAPGVITGMARIEGKSVGIIANNGSIDAGAITSSCAVKTSAFLGLCDKYEWPVISLIDTPGIMVGPEAEKSGTVRHAGDLFVAGANFSQPFLSIVLRRAYGLGAMAMMGGSTHRSHCTISWPSGEFGAMGIEGAIKLGYRKELESIGDEKERKEYFENMVAEAYDRGKAISMASMLEIDDVVEPRETRAWISALI